MALRMLQKENDESDADKRGFGGPAPTLAHHLSLIHIYGRDIGCLDLCAGHTAGIQDDLQSAGIALRALDVVLALSLIHI